MPVEFRTPQSIYYGSGSVSKVSDITQGLGKRALIVSDHVMAQLGHIDRVIEQLQAAGIGCVSYLGVDTEPTDVHVTEALQVLRDEDCDVIIAIGGGSCIDAAKAVAVMAVNDGYIGDYMGGKKRFANAPIPLVAVPTTAGTGSEVTSVTVITNTKDDVKMMIRQPKLVPAVAIVDAELTVSSPPKVTAATGIDALCHAIEAYISRVSHPLTDALALSAIEKITRSIRLAYADGQNLQAREEMALAAMQAGMAFSNASVCLVHGMSRPIGAVFHVPHGVSNAMLLPTVLEYSKGACTDKLAVIGHILNPEMKTPSDEEVADMVVDQVKQLCSDLQIPNMKSWGIDETAFHRVIGKMAQDAIASGSPGSNPRVPSHEEIVELYQVAYDADFTVSHLSSQLSSGGHS